MTTSLFQRKLKKHHHNKSTEESIQIDSYEAVRIQNLISQRYLLAIFSFPVHKLYGRVQIMESLKSKIGNKCF